MSDSAGVKTALITGGSRGIGAAIAAELRTRKLQVIAPPRSELNLEQPESVQHFIKANQGMRVDVLINNAGINVLNSVCDIDLPTWSRMVQTNVTSALALIQGFVPAMAARGWGRVLSVSSIFSLVTRERRAAYSMSKAALNALTRTAAVEFGSQGVLVNCLAPGYVETDLTRQNNTPEQIAAIASGIPLRRLAQPGELAKVAAFLVSEDNTYITGQVIVADGGFTCL